MNKTILLIAAAALSATPAIGQNASTPANDAAANTTANAAMAAPGNEMVVDNGIVAAPVDMNAVAPPEEAAPTPAPTPVRKTFPWGVIGLVGLIGLLGRRRRD
jgi:MYXO-CTERM domain-containing protein